MSYQVRILARAQQDFEDYVAWISERSPQGAERWVAAFEATLSRLEQNPFVAPIANESEELGEEVRNIMFRTRAGRTFRALFVVVGDEVRILRIRGSGQAPATRDDIES
jgi:plasmid stabilization system protein ParE